MKFVKILSEFTYQILKKNHNNPVFFISAINQILIMSALEALCFCDDALYKLTLTLTLFILASYFR